MDFKKNVSNYSSKKMEKLTQTTIRQGGIVLKEAIQTPETYLKNKKVSLMDSGEYSNFTRKLHTSLDNRTTTKSVRD